METLMAIGIAGAFALGVLMGLTVFNTHGGLPLVRRRAIEAALRAERPDDTFRCVVPAWSVTVVNAAGYTRQVALTEKVAERETPDDIAHRAAEHLRDGPGVLVHFAPAKQARRAGA